MAVAWASETNLGGRRSPFHHRAWRGDLAVLSVAVILLISHTLHAHGAFHDVVDALNKELREKPDDTALRFKLAEAYAGHEDPRACMMQLKLIERLSPGRFPTGYLRGLSLYIAGNDNLAKQVLDDFLILNPGHGDALVTRGKILMKLGQPSDAARDFQTAFDMAQGPNTDLILDLAKAYDQIGEPEKACTIIDKGLKTAGDTPSLLECALLIESSHGEWDAALGRIDSLQNKSPIPEIWMAERARTLAKAGRHEEAAARWSTLRDRLLSLPTLERGYPHNADLLHQSRQALGEAAPATVFAPPASGKP
jgi:tetratricopeptide (TPR) repeat protein